MSAALNPLALAMQDARAGVEHDQLLIFSREAQAAVCFAAAAPTDALIESAMEAQLHRLTGMAELPAGDAPHVAVKLAALLRLRLQDSLDDMDEAQRVELLLLGSALSDLVLIGTASPAPVTRALAAQVHA